MNKFVLVALALLGVAAHAHEFSSEHTKELSSSNYEDEVASGKVYLIAFFAPWCGHCKHLAPKWVELGAALKDNKDAVVAFVDCTQNRDICQNAEVKGYPTIKAFHNSEEYQTYRGQREVPALKTFVEEAVSALLTESS